MICSVVYTRRIPAGPESIFDDIENYSGLKKRAAIICTFQNLPRAPISGFNPGVYRAVFYVSSLFLFLFYHKYAGFKWPYPGRFWLLKYPVHILPGALSVVRSKSHHGSSF